MKVLVQNWIESERGWGQRPDGCSIHLDMKKRDQFVKDYWSMMPDSTPDEYSAPYGDPYEVDCLDLELLAGLEGYRVRGERFWKTPSWARRK